MWLCVCMYLRMIRSKPYANRRNNDFPMRKGTVIDYVKKGCYNSFLGDKSGRAVPFSTGDNPFLHLVLKAHRQ